MLRLYADWIGQREARGSRAARSTPARSEAPHGPVPGGPGTDEAGWELANSDPIAARAFRLANEAMLYQQLRSRLPLRAVERGKDDVWRPVGPQPEPVPQPGQGQLAAVPDRVPAGQPARTRRPRRHPSRSLVDLIFFPTGGGKTEAYLGASAISLLARRLRDPHDAGTDTLMRYTLRLLTAQQFLRAAALVCVLEDIRSSQRERAGRAPRSASASGSEAPSTPNRWSNAQRRASSKLQPQSERAESRSCCCAARGAAPRWAPKPRKGRGAGVLGYVLVGKAS